MHCLLVVNSLTDVLEVIIDFGHEMIMLGGLPDQVGLENCTNDCMTRWAYLFPNTLAKLR